MTKQEKVAIAAHCNLRLPEAALVVLDGLMCDCLEYVDWTESLIVIVIVDTENGH